MSRFKPQFDHIYNSNIMLKDNIHFVHFCNIVTIIMAGIMVTVMDYTKNNATIRELTMHNIGFGPSFIFLAHILLNIFQFLGFFSNFQGLVAMETRISQLFHALDQNDHHFHITHTIMNILVYGNK